jgi:hypothetical protein
MKSVTRPSTPRRLSPAFRLAAVFALALLAPAAAPVATSAMHRSPAADPGAVAGFRPETRLRKLHLVRPDLIPYPIAYEVYC